MGKGPGWGSGSFACGGQWGRGQVKRALLRPTFREWGTLPSGTSGIFLAGEWGTLPSGASGILLAGERGKGEPRQSGTLGPGGDPRREGGARLGIWDFCKQTVLISTRWRSRLLIRNAAVHSYFIINRDLHRVLINPVSMLTRRQKRAKCAQAKTSTFMAGLRKR